MRLAGCVGICRALGNLVASEKLMFWLREHGALAGKSVASALDGGTALAEVERLAASWARDRGSSRVTADAGSRFVRGSAATDQDRSCVARVLEPASGY
jgi:hypothetical protein